MAIDRTVRYPGTPDRRGNLQRHRRIISEISDRGQFGRDGGTVDRMLTYWDRPDDEMGSGDPASDAGVKIALSELSDEVVDFISTSSGAAGVLLEVILTFAADFPANTVINIQTGAHVGGPASVQGDVITLPATGVLFEDGGHISITLNGQELQRGRMSGVGEAYWVSTTQIGLNAPLEIFAGNKLVVRSPT